MTFLHPRKRPVRGDPYKAGTPYLAGMVVGVREWRVDTSRGVLMPRFGEGTWLANGEATRAECLRGSNLHRAPDPDCTCGLHAFHPWNRYGDSLIAPGNDPGCVVGFIFAWGRLEVHGEGFRAEFAKPAAFLLRDPDSSPCLGDADARELREMWAFASRCGAETIDPEDEKAIEDWLDRHQGQLGPETIKRLVPEVLPEDLEVIRSTVGTAPNPEVVVSPVAQVVEGAKKTLMTVVKGVAYLLYGTYATVVVGIQVAFWAFLFFVVLAHMTGIDPFHIDADPPREVSRPIPKLDIDWHPPMAK